jgi:predicted N-formylglutamate amidohydrolase
MDTSSRLHTPVYQWHPGSNLHWLILCDHAANRVPAPLSELGLSRFDLTRHIAWDIGAADVARRLARQLRAPMIEHAISRLVIDANRGSDDPTLIPAISDDTPIPGNQNLTRTEVDRRWREYHQPYHRRIDRHLNQLAGTSLVPLVLSIHSFTPALGSIGETRPWPVGVLWRHDPTFAHHLIRELSRDGTLVGDNQPYDGHLAMGYTVDHHAIRRGLPYTMIELRQDQLSTPAVRAQWANRLQRALVRTANHFRPRSVHVEPGDWRPELGIGHLAV